MSFRVVLSSDDGKNISKITNHLILGLNSTNFYNLKDTGWLTELSTTEWDETRKTHELYVCSDICQDTFIGEKEVSLLRRVYLGDKK